MGKAPVIIGRPFAPIGVGEHVRSASRAAAAACMNLPVMEMYRAVNGYSHDHPVDPRMLEEFEERLVFTQSDRLNIFAINGDEASFAKDAGESLFSHDTYSVIYPFWELSKYPLDWAKQLNRFHEVWAPSKFIFDALWPVIDRPLRYMPMPTEISITHHLGRRYFGIRESSFAYLFFFDFRSYITRKNPFAALRAFAEVRAKRPHADILLVIKLNPPTQQESPVLYAQYQEFLEEAQKFGNGVTVIDQVYDDNETKNLVHCCDCFLSLHRSEGYGRGLSEAMSLGKPVIGTAYSGNMDFMNESNSLLVPYELIPVQEGEYPYWQDQVWANPDEEAAAAMMIRLLDEPSFGRKLGETARRDMRTNFSYRATGLQLRQRVDEILGRAPDIPFAELRRVDRAPSVDYRPFESAPTEIPRVGAKIVCLLQPEFSTDPSEQIKEAYELAREYGINGFCLDIHPQDLEWLSGLGDGSATGCELTIQWHAPPEPDIESFVTAAAPLLAGPHAFRLEDKPVLCIQTNLTKANSKKLLQGMRTSLERHGVPNVYLVLALSTGATEDDLDGWDAGLSMQAENSLGEYTATASGDALSYAALVAQQLKSWRIEKEGPTRMLSVFPSEKRFFGSTPQTYRLWLQHAVEAAVSGIVANLVFIESWNDHVAESALMPSKELGHAYLSQTREALLWTHALQQSRLESIVKLGLLREAYDAIEQPPHNPIIVFQMAKVGSSSVVAAMAATGRHDQVVHVHVLDDLDGIEENQIRATPNPKPILEQLAFSKRVRSWIDRAPTDTKWNVITMAREPVSRNISAFFEAIELYFPDFQKRLNRNAVSVGEVREAFLHLSNHTVPEAWFNYQLKPVFDIDVFDQPFDFDKKYVIRDGKNCRLLILRTGDIDMTLQPAMEEFIGWIDVKPVHVNIGSEKGYRDFIREFKKNPLPKWYIEEMLSTRYARHFYTEEELARLVKKYT